jgi:hypothetical protein
VVRGGGSLVRRFVREQPLAFSLAVTGAVAFTAAIVASAVVIGYVTDELIVPVLAEGAPVEGRLRTAVTLILAVALWKAVGIVVRRTTAGWVQYGAHDGCARPSWPTSCGSRCAGTGRGRSGTCCRCRTTTPSARPS